MFFLKSLFKKEQIRTRFAPSPTGPLHIGGARTALFNFLFAKKYGGKFILRIEDTDLERSDLKYEKSILEGFRWLGISWDEGPEIGGPYGPYRQSDRMDIYTKHLKKLLDSGNAFYCFHSKDFLEKEHEEQLAQKKVPAHFCDHKKLSRRDAEKKLEEESAIVRFKLPLKKDICFKDLVRGDICFDSGTLGGDFSLAKAANPGKSLPLYNFAAVIDDFTMKITHVIRGEDHISNTPKQILIAQALNFPIPQFAHLPLILGPDKSKLSKRHAAVSVAEYQDAGYLPEALINFMALLGWNPGTNQETFSLDELAKEFDMAKIQKSGAIFNIEKFDWLNGYYLRQLPITELTEKTIPFLIKFGFIEPKNYDVEYIKKVIALEQPRLKKFGELETRMGFFFNKPEYEPELLVWRDMSFENIAASLGISLETLVRVSEPEWNFYNLEKILLEKAKKSGKGDRGELLWPLRAALTGLKTSPGPFEILEVLGKKESIERINAAIGKLKA